MGICLINGSMEASNFYTPNQGLAYGSLIWNGYIPNTYYIPNEGPYFKPYPNKQEDGKGPKQGPIFHASNRESCRNVDCP